MAGMQKLLSGIGAGLAALGLATLPEQAEATVFNFAGGLSPCAEVGPFGGGADDNVGLDGVGGNADDDPCGARSGQPGSPHTGTFTGAYDDVSQVFSFEFSYTGLSNPPPGHPLFDPNPFSDWHVHLGDPGENGPIMLAGGNIEPPPADSNPLADSVFITEATTSVVGLTVADFESVLQAGGFYINIHSNAYRQGELRTQIEQIAMPEPATLGLLGLALFGLGVMRHARRA